MSEYHSAREDPSSSSSHSATSSTTSTGPVRLRRLKSLLGKANPGRWIDDLENCQEIADQLEYMNAEIEEENDRRAMRIEAQEACLLSIKTHLSEFLQDHPDGSYEEWIRALHPENAHSKHPITTSDDDIDHRFYVEESDHRRLWNKTLQSGPNASLTRDYVPARSFANFDSGQMLLDQETSNSDGSTSSTTNEATTSTSHQHSLELANKLEQMNAEIADANNCHEMRIQAQEACLSSMKTHLSEFLQDHPDGSYEEWVRALHPENAHSGHQITTSDGDIDHRFYVEESDHRRLWNKMLQSGPNASLTREYVPARSVANFDSAPSLHSVVGQMLLDQETSNNDGSTSSTTNVAAIERSQTASDSDKCENRKNTRAEEGIIPNTTMPWD